MPVGETSLRSHSARLTRWLVLVAVVCVVGLIVVSSGGLVASRLVGKCFAGACDFDKSSWCWLRVANHELTGECNSNRGGALSFDGEDNGIGGFRIHRGVLSGEATVGNAMRLKLKLAQEEDDDGQLHWTGELPQVAELHSVSKTHGLRIGNYGCSCRHETFYPKLLKMSPLHQAASTHLRQLATEFVTEQDSVTWSDINFGLRCPNFMNQWQSTLWLDVVHESSDVIAIRRFRWEYLGGTRGYESLTAHNFSWRDGRLVDLKLSDLFETNTDWQTPLAELVRDELIRQGANDLVDRDDDGMQCLSQTGKQFSVSNLRQFLVLPTGLQFLFIPYGTECTEGRGFEIHISFDSLNGLRKAFTLR